ncbi:MAG TPA: hypothetical protein VH062_11165 [Polyangiaceae bacterium]|nr:hypothetical protein [Polyangiaceae bacterium]
MRVQGVLTVVAEIATERASSLVELLAELDRAMSGDALPSYDCAGEPTLVGKATKPIVDFPSLSTVHFARFAVLGANAAGKRHLLFSSAYDGPRASHLAELVERAGEGLDAVFAHCVGYGAGAPRSALVPYLEANAVKYGAMHVGYVGRCVSDVQQEEALRRHVGRVLDERKLSTLPSPELPARAIRSEIIRLVAEGEYRWALEPRAASIAPRSVEGWWKTGVVAALAVAGLAGSLVGAFALGFGIPYVLLLGGAAAVVVVVLRHHEDTEPAKTDTDVSGDALANAEDEDFGITNQLTHVVAIKPGAFRMAVLRVVLFAIELRARFEFYKGDLGGIETIHCAHWAILDKAEPRLLFCSNYDGSWERYLGDFIEEAGAGMTAVWSNTVNYPRSKLLVEEGAKNERVFKAWTRDHQVRTDVWYRANPDISCRNLNDNSRLRDGLRGYMSEADARAWLRYL